MQQQLFNLFIGLVISAGIYYLSTLPLPALVSKLVQILSILVGVVVVINFIAFLLGVSSPVGI